MKYKHIHFVGIKGVGMTALAIAAKEAGIIVSGSDIAQDFITTPALLKAKIVPLTGFDKVHIANADLVITTGAHGGFDNPEVIAAKEKEIPVMTHGEALGAFLSGELFGKALTGIAIAGTHGKTTTTALIATIFTTLGLDPSYIIGTGSIKTLTKPGHFGKGKYFIVEADEYATEPTYEKKARFLWLKPTIAVITNIEHDHPDIYPTIADVEKAFSEFASSITLSGVLIACGDDSHAMRIAKAHSGRKVTYGFSPANDYVISHITISKEHMFFRVTANNMDLGEFSLRIIGEHNAQNALAAIIVALEAGIPIEKIKQALSTFTGSKRRFEYLGQMPSGARVYDDYAHHPTEIKKTLHALRLLYTKKKLVVVFQPHTYSRTKELFSDFTRSFSDADSVIVTDIFASLREEKDESVSSQNLAISLKQNHKSVEHIASLSQVVEYLKKNAFDEDTVVILMGAGDIYTIASDLSLSDNDG